MRRARESKRPLSTTFIATLSDIIIQWNESKTNDIKIVIIIVLLLVLLLFYAYVRACVSWHFSVSFERKVERFFFTLIALFTLYIYLLFSGYLWSIDVWPISLEKNCHVRYPHKICRNQFSCPMQPDWESGWEKKFHFTPFFTIKEKWRECE